MYGCETWSLTLRKEHRLRLRVFENRVLRGIFGPKRDEVPGEWRKLYNEELNDLYSSPNIVWVIKLRMRWAGNVAHMGEKRGVYRILVGYPRKRDLFEDSGIDGRIILTLSLLTTTIVAPPSNASK